MIDEEDICAALAALERAPNEEDICAALERAPNAGVLAAAEWCPFADPALRARVVAALTPLLSLDPPALSAIRLFGRLVPAAESGVLLPLLARERDVLVRQTALQAIQNIFSVDPPEPGEALEALRSGVRDLMDAVLRDEELRQHIPAASLALSGVHAALLLRDGAAHTYVARMKTLGLAPALELLPKELLSA